MVILNATPDPLAPAGVLEFVWQIHLAVVMSPTYRVPMTSERGVALILALIVLAFLTVVGGALLTTTTIDARISDNFNTGMQSFYAAETGVEEARELLRTTALSATQLLTTAAGTDGIVATADDRPLISGGTAGHYDVWLRNDNADGADAVTDTNDVLTLVSIGKMRNAEKTIEVTVRRPGIDASDPMLAERIAVDATDVYSPPAGTAETIGDYGSPANYRIAVVNGDVNLAGGSGYGILVARGNVNVSGNLTWNGVIIVASPGVLQWSAVGGVVNGSVIVGQTRLAESWIHYDADAFAAANKLLPYVPISIRER